MQTTLSGRWRDMGEFADKLAAQSPAFVRAYLGSLAPSLVKSGKLEKYYQTLTDFDFITAKINYPEFGVQLLIDDYDLIDGEETLNYSEYNSEKVKSLKLIQGALRLSAHILAVDKGQLASHLHGRLLNQKMPEEIQELLAQIKQGKTTPWLCPLTPSLTPPGKGLLRTLKGHINLVNAVAVTPNGQQVISASSDNTLKVWNLADGKQILTLKDHINSVNDVAIISNGQQVISASSDNTLQIWNLADGKELLILYGHAESVNTVVVTPNGRQVISASSDKTLKVWNLADGKELITLKGHTESVNAVAVTPNGQQVISASSDNKLIVWNLADGKEGFFNFMMNLITGRQLLILYGHTESVNAVAVTPNGQQVISASSDKTLKVWNLADGKELLTLYGHAKSVNAVAVISNGQQVISASSDKTLKVWNLADGKELLTLYGHTESVNAVAVTPNGQQVISASSDTTLKVWNLADGEEGFFSFMKNIITGRELLALHANFFALNTHIFSENAVAVTPNGQQVISASRSKTLKVWKLADGKEGFFSFIRNLITGRQILTLRGHTNSVNAVAVTPNGQQLISASRDKTLKVWNLADGKELLTLNGHTSWVNAVTVSPNGQQVISASWDNTLKVWNLATGEVIATFTGESSINCCAVAPDRMTIVAGERSGRVHFLRLEGMRGNS
ncbi:MAG: WD40 repeat domain-containing protein [Nostoc sp. DedSLP01]